MTVKSATALTTSSDLAMAGSSRPPIDLAYFQGPSGDVADPQGAGTPINGRGGHNPGYDEIDKADYDFPNDLLAVLDRWSFVISEPIASPGFRSPS